MIMLALDAAAVFAVWQGESSLPAKVILTALLIGHFAGTFCLVSISASEPSKKIGAVVLICMLAGMLAYALASAETGLAIMAGSALALWVVWSWIVVFCIGVGRNKEK